MKILYFISFLLFFKCSNIESNQTKINKFTILEKKVNNQISISNTLASRIAVPKNFQRQNIDTTSFAYYLSHLTLKPEGTLVKYYDGTYKTKKNVYCAVVDFEIGKKNLVQCADAVMLLRGNYLYSQKKIQEIHFNFTNGFNAEYSKWMQGYRILVEGNKTTWQKKFPPSNSYNDFLNFMEMVYSYAGTLSLSKELKPKLLKNLEIGDVFIFGGSPGHAVIVVDKAINKQNKIVFLLAQSYMPAQEIQILINPNEPNLSPWYSTEFGETLLTPEWTFTANQLKSFE